MRNFIQIFPGLFHQKNDLSKVTSHFEEVFRFMDAGRATGKVLLHCFEGKNRWVDRVVGTTWKKHVLKIGSVVSLLLFRALDATVCANLEGHKIILWFQIKPAWKFTLIDCQPTVRQPDLHSWLMPVVFCTEKPEVMMSWWLDFCCFNNQSLTSNFFWHRSATFVIAYLMQKEGCNLYMALSRVKSVRSFVDLTLDSLKGGGATIGGSMLTSQRSDPLAFSFNAGE